MELQEYMRHAHAHSLHFPFCSNCLDHLSRYHNRFACLGDRVSLDIGRLSPDQKSAFVQRKSSIFDTEIHRPGQVRKCASDHDVGCCAPIRVRSRLDRAQGREHRI